MNNNTILLVEDETFFALQEAQELEKEGFEVVKAYSGEEAIQKVNAGQPAISLILMDINLGAGMDGIQTAQKILKEHDIPVIFLSSETEPEIVSKTEAITSYGYVLKSTGIAVLVASIKMAFRLHSAHQTIQQTNENLHLAQAASHAGTWDWNIVDDIFTWSPEFMKIFGLPPGTPVDYELWKKTLYFEDREAAVREFQQAADLKTNLVSEFRVVLPGGEIRWIRSTGQTYFDGDQVRRMTGLCMDITERKLVEQALRESETQLRTLSDNLPGGLVYQVDTGEDGLQRQFTYISAGVKQLHGVTAAQALQDARLIYDQIHAEDRQQLAELEAAAISSMTPFSMETRLQLPSGVIRWRLFTSAPRRLPNGHMIWDGIELDITDRKQVEDALHFSQEKFSKAFHSIPDVIVLSRLRDGKIIDVNESFTLITGYSRQEALSSTSTALNLFANPGDRERFIAAINSEKTIRNQELILNTKSGEKLNCLLSAEFIDLRGERYILSVIHNLTAIKQTEEKLLEIEQRYRTLVETADDAITLTDLQGKHLIDNDAFYSSLGYTRGDEVNFDGFDRVHPDDLPAVMTALNELFEQGHSSGEYRVRHKDGHWIYRYNKATLLRDAEGRPQSILSVIRDTTERKLMEEKLSQSEKHFRSLVENSYDAITLVGRDGLTSYQSPAVARLTGFPAEETHRHNAMTNVYPDDRPILQAATDRLLSHPGHMERMEFRSVRKDGTVWWTEATATNLLEEPSVQAIVVNYRDITARKQAEAALQQAIIDREMLIKELQHRVKNSLTTAASLIGLERTNLADARARSIFANTEARIQSMAMLYDQLNQGDHINHIDLRSYLQDLVKGLSQSYQAANSPVTIETRIADCQVQPDVALPVGLIVNELVTNALKYAFPQGQAGVIQVALEENDGVKCLCVSDNGVGFTPTSSGRDRRGLGITLVEMFATQLGGDLSITDGPGLTVRVKF